MNKQSQCLNMRTQSEGQSSKEKLTSNPRKAATKAKEISNHVQIMRKRLQVLQVQEDYNRYKTLDHEKRISQHNKIHEKIVRDKQLLRKSLEKVTDISEAKQKNRQLRLQIRERIKQAMQSLVEDRSNRTQLIAEESAQHENAIKQHREREALENRERKMTVQFQQERKRKSVTSHAIQKLSAIRANRSEDSGALTRRTQQSQHELSKLMAQEQGLLKKNSDTLQISQVMRHKFNEVFETNSSNRSRLPSIRARTNNSKYANSSEMAAL